MWWIFVSLAVLLWCCDVWCCGVVVLWFVSPIVPSRLEVFDCHMSCLEETVDCWDSIAGIRSL